MEKLIEGWKNYFFFYKRLCIPHKDRKLSDPVARQLMFIQLRSDVMHSRMACNMEEAVDLAVLLLLVYQGIPEQHVSKSWLTLERLSFILPNVWIQETQIRLRTWQDLIVNKYNRASDRGLNRAMARDLYIVKCERLHNYGFTLFYPCRHRLKKDGYVRLGHRIILGVSCTGVRVCSDYAPSGVIHDISWADIVNFSSTKDIISFDVRQHGTTMYFRFECPVGMADSIIDLMQAYSSSYTKQRRAK